MELTTPRALKWIRVRMIVVGVLLAGGFGAIAWRTVVLQLRESPKLRALAEEQYLKVVDVPPRRGSVYFRDGSQLAISLDVDSVWANTRALPQDPTLAGKLAHALDLPVEEVRAKLASRRYFVWLKRRVAPEQARAVRELAIKGVTLTPEPRRFYPNGELAGPVIGFAGVDGKGIDGVELALDNLLRGEGAQIPGLKDALGRVVFTGQMPDDPSTTGSAVVLTLDRFVQFSAERALRAGVAAAKAKAGMAVVMDPRTSEILAMATWPTLDPNRPEGSGPRGARLRPITDPYEPGSTMKMFSVSGALDARVVTPDESFDCEHGEFMVGGQRIHDSHPHDQLTVSEIVKFSSNIGAAKIAHKLGRERLEGYLHKFGFGRPTGIEVTGERGGTLRPSARWGEAVLATVSYGQGMTATALQLTTAMAAIANGGIYHPARLVKSILGPRGEELALPPAEGLRVISERAAKQMARIMVTVTETGGTATEAALDGFEVAGKTGTAQKVREHSGHYGKGMFIASFAGFVPADDPRLAILVVLDEPDIEKHFGGEVAAPIFKQIAEETLRYLGVTQVKQLVASAPAREGTAAPAAALQEEQSAEEDGSDESDAEDDEEPVAGAALVPDFTGMSLGQALVAARHVGLKVEVTGNGVAIGQSPGPGRAAHGARCRIAFRPPAEALGQ